jgi:hypothetical protein
MKISTKNLDEFRELAEECKTLGRKDFDGKVLGGFIIGILITLFWITLGVANSQYNWHLENIGPCGLLIVYIGSCILAVTLDDLFRNTYIKLFNYFSHQSKDYLRLKELEAYLPTIIPKLGTQIKAYCESDLTILIEQIYANSQNKVVYENLLSVLSANDSFVREAFKCDKLLRIEYIIKYEAILKRNDIWFDYQIEEEARKDRFEQIIKSFRNSETKRKPSASSSYNPLGLSSTPNIQNKPIEKRQEKPIERSNQTERTSTPKEPKPSENINVVFKVPPQKPMDSKELAALKADYPNIVNRLRERFGDSEALNISSFESEKTKVNLETPKQQELEFEQETGNLIKTDTLPERRKRLTRPRVIKASPEFWKNLQNNRMETGKRGELLVMEYERKRIIKEEGKEFLYHLQHSSVTEGDGLGFDISSFYERRNVGIEVKTTTGNFDSNLIFTQNEINSMKILGENYFLYRVYNFDKKTNEGKLQIFKGREEIEAFFDFTPQTFTLKRKN